MTVWDQGVFKLSVSALESLLKILDNSDFGMFIFSPDDLVTIRGDENASVRDNVVFELGLFFGRLGKGRCFILTPDDATDLRIPTDLLGILPGTYEATRSDGNLISATAPASHMIQEQIQELGLAAQRIETPGVIGIPYEQDKNLELEAVTGKPPTIKAESGAVDEQLHWLGPYIDREFDKALDLLRIRLDEEADPEEQVRLKAWMGRIKYRMDPNEGTLELQRLIQKHPKNSDPYIHLAYAHLGRGHCEGSLQVIEDGLSNANDKSELFEAKARYYLKLGEDDQAEKTLKDAVRQ